MASYYKDLQLMRKKVEKTIQKETETHGGVKIAKLIVGTLTDYPVSKKSISEYITLLEDGGYIKKEGDIIIWA